MKNKSSLEGAGESEPLVSLSETGKKWAILGAVGLIIVGLLASLLLILVLSFQHEDTQMPWDGTWKVVVLFVGLGLAAGLACHGLPFQFKAIRYGDSISIGATEIEEYWDEYDE